MHWFWRAAIAATVGVLYATYASFSAQEVYYRFAEPLKTLTGIQINAKFGTFVVLVAPVVLVMLAIYGLVSYFLKCPRDRETRCRKCQYILRGISEPRCPECGERI